jgi:uncharacterized membrane protein YccC
MKKLAPRDIVFAANMMLACWLSYAAATWALVRFADKPDDLLGGMWAVIATIFVFRETRIHSWSSALDRLLATVVSFALCLAYLLAFRSTPLAIGLLVGIGTVVMMLLNRRDDVIVTGITTTVVLVCAAISPEHAWLQPVLRLVDTLIGVVVGLSCKWIASYAFSRAAGEPAQ